MVSELTGVISPSRGSCPNHMHQTKSAFSVGELVSHNDFHGGPSPSNLHDGAGDGHNLHYDDVH